MKLPVVAALSAAAALGISPALPVAAAASGRRPTRAQIRTAVRDAKHSPNLWATVNICNTKKYPHMIGIRGQMPALGFRSTLSMEIQVDYYNPTHKRFEPIPGVKHLLAIGPATNGLYQAGVSFGFNPPAALSGEISFTWKLSGKAIGRVTRRTTDRHKRVEHGDPPGHSAASCDIAS